MASYPPRVSIREVGPRDGFQNEPEVIPTADKVRLIELLIASGLRRLEVTSFVRADVIPQLADGAEVLAALERPDDVSFSVLIPNERGLEPAFVRHQHRQRHVVGRVDLVQHLGGVGKLRDHVGADEARDLEPPDAGAGEHLDQPDLVVGGDDLGLVLEAVTRADFADPDLFHGKRA